MAPRQSKQRYFAARRSRLISMALFQSVIIERALEEGERGSRRAVRVCQRQERAIPLSTLLLAWSPPLAVPPLSTPI
jgi:hypothetical protein